MLNWGSETNVCMCVCVSLIERNWAIRIWICVSDDGQMERTHVKVCQM